MHRSSPQSAGARASSAYRRAGGQRSDRGRCLHTAWASASDARSHTRARTGARSAGAADLGVLSVDVRAAHEQGAHRLHVPVLRRRPDRLVALPVGLVRVCARRKQLPHLQAGRGVFLIRRPAAGPAAAVPRGRPPSQHAVAHRPEMAALRGGDDRRRLVDGVRVEVGPARGEQPDALAAAGGLFIKASESSFMKPKRKPPKHVDGFDQFGGWVRAAVPREARWGAATAEALPAWPPARGRRGSLSVWGQRGGASSCGPA